MCWYDSKNADTIAEYRANQSKKDRQAEQLTLKSEIFWKQQITIGKREVFPNHIPMSAEIPLKMGVSVFVGDLKRKKYNQA